MDLRLDDEQKGIVDAVRTLCARTAGPQRARTEPDRTDRQTLQRLDEAGFLDVAQGGGARDHLAAVLITEQAAQSLVMAPVGARALVAVNDWCRKNRHQPVRDQHVKLSAKLVGHYAYYGITGNIAQLSRYARQLARLWRKWLARRTRPHVLTWDSFNALLERHPLPQPRIVHHYAKRGEALP